MNSRKEHRNNNLPFSYLALTIIASLIPGSILASALATATVASDYDGSGWAAQDGWFLFTAADGQKSYDIVKASPDAGGEEDGAGGNVTAADTATTTAAADNSTEHRYDIGISRLQVKDVDGYGVVDCSNGCAPSMMMLTAEMRNYQPRAQPFVVYLEVRDAETGYTVFNEFGMGTLNPDGSAEVGISWIPNADGKYELRSFVVDSLQSTERISRVATLPIAIGS